MAELSNGSNAIKNSEKNSIRPSFGRQSHGERQDSAIANLGSYEGGAADNNFFGGDANDNGAAENADEQQSNLFSDASDREEQPDDGFTNAVRGRDEKVDGKGEGKVKTFLKKKSAVIILTLITGGTGAFMFSAQSMMPFSLLEQLRTTYDSITTSMELRSDVMLTKQLKNDEIKNPLTKKYFGVAGSDKYKFSSKQKTKLDSEGLYIEEDFGGTGKTAILFDDGSGSLKIVGASSDDLELFKGIDLENVKIKNENVDMNKLKLSTDGMDTFEGKFKSSTDFKNGYTKSSRTWRGAVGAWFDNVTVKFLQSNSITRNMFKDFQKKVQAENDGNTRAAAIAVMKGDSDGIEVKDGELKTKDGKKVMKDADGYYYEGANEPVRVKDEDIAYGATKTKVTNADEVTAEVKNIADDEVNKTGASSMASTVANTACTVFSIIGTVELLVAAQEGMQIVQVVTGYFEAIDKAKAGNGGESPINELANALITPTDTTVEKSTAAEGGAIYDDLYKTEEVRVNGKENMTAMQSSGISSLYAGTKINTNDESVSNFNIGTRFQSILGRIGTGMNSFMNCAYAKMMAAMVGFAEDAISILACVFSFGIGCVADAIIDAGESVAGSVMLAEAVSFAVQQIVPLAVRWFTKDLVSDLAGEDLGNALVSGANMYMGTNHRTGGGSLTNYDGLIAFRTEQEKVIAREAEYQRTTRSPFDASSQYTFLGSLMTKMAALNTMTSAPTNIISTIGSIVNNSVIALLPSASAIDIASTVMTNEELEQVCPSLAAIGATGDAFCNPYIVTDVSTLGVDPDTVIETVNTKYGGLVADSSSSDYGQIEEDSNLAKYIKYCDLRTSSFGVADNNIAGDFDTGSINTGIGFLDTALNTIVGAIPLVGDGIDWASNQNQLDNGGWISGESCVIGNDASKNYAFIDDKSESISWEEAKYYQRYIEDQRLLESTNEDYTSTVTAFINKYYEENPLDNSYEGILARKSGLTKEQVVATLDIIEYQNYLANYNPLTRYSFINDTEENGRIYIEMPEMDNIAILENETLYYDNRNRIFAIA